MLLDTLIKDGTKNILKQSKNLKSLKIIKNKIYYLYCFVQKLNLFFSLRKSKDLKNKIKVERLNKRVGELMDNHFLEKAIQSSSLLKTKHSLNFYFNKK